MKRNDLMRHVLVFAAFLIILLSSGLAQVTPPKGTIYLFRRSYAPGNKPSVILDGTRIARMQSGSYFSILVDAGVHRLESTPHSQMNASLNFEEEMTDIDVPAGKTVYVELTFAEARWLKHARFTPTPATIARDRFPALKPLDRKWAFDDRVEMTKPDFP